MRRVLLIITIVALVSMPLACDTSNDTYEEPVYVEPAPSGHVEGGGSAM